MLGREKKSIEKGKIWVTFSICHLHTSFQDLRRSAYIYPFKMKKNYFYRSVLRRPNCYIKKRRKICHTCSAKSSNLEVVWYQNVRNSFKIGVGWLVFQINFYKKSPSFFPFWIKNTKHMTQIPGPWESALHDPNDLPAPPPLVHQLQNK